MACQGLVNKVWPARAWLTKCVPSRGLVNRVGLVSKVWPAKAWLTKCGLPGPGSQHSDEVTMATTVMIMRMMMMMIVLLTKMSKMTMMKGRMMHDER